MLRGFFALAIAAVAFSLIAFSGCEGPEGPRGPAGASGTLPVYVLGSVISPQERDSTTDADVEIYHSPGIPHVDINGVRLTPNDPFYRGCDPFRFLKLDLPISFGDSARLHVVFPEPDGTFRIAQANIRLPGRFEIIAPDSSYDTLSIRDSLVICWSPSEGVSYYWIEFFMQYEYTDTSGSWHYFEYSVDSAVTDTCLLFPKNTFLPTIGEIDSVDYGYGNLSLWAINGPTPEDDQGNVTGDGMGFFYGRTWGGNVLFSVQDSSPLPGEMTEPQDFVKRLAEERAKRLRFD